MERRRPALVRETVSVLWEDVITPRARPRAGAGHLRVRGLDGYAATIPLEEGLRDESLLADRLDGEPLGDHGAPLRLVLPHLYAYKSVKHVCRIEVTAKPVRASGGRLLSHPRARVDREERSGVGAQRSFRGSTGCSCPCSSRARARRRR
jgi:DMSO/TMAO reductase YedYZ molybdopterin-dependent catalytic subunit